MPEDMISPETALAVLTTSDLARLTAQARNEYYLAACRQAGLEPWMRPFDYLLLNGKLVLYLNKVGCEGLRTTRNISTTILSSGRVDGDLWMTHVRQTDGSGRSDEAHGVVSVANLKGDSYANAIMKAETKAKNRCTKSLSGIAGMTTEDEIETIPGAKRVRVTDEGRVVDLSGRDLGLDVTPPADDAQARTVVPEPPQAETPPEPSTAAMDDPVDAGDQPEFSAVVLGDDPFAGEGPDVPLWLEKFPTIESRKYAVLAYKNTLGTASKVKDIVDAVAPEYKSFSLSTLDLEQWGVVMARLGPKAFGLE